MSRRIDKAELISKVRELAGLTRDEKSALLELLNEKKTYGLVWENHEEAVEEQLREQLPVLREVPERRLLSKDADAPNHIIIEAENLHALVALTYTHAGMIDVMYLDPPYNTGKKDDFVYNDSYVDSEDSFRHSKWLSFMEKRLKIAQTLLSDNGVIFISIDDNEQANLKLLCDDIFGENLFVTDLIWRSSDSSNNDAKKFSVDYNHTLVYAKNQLWQPIKIERTADNNLHYKNPDNDPNGPWFSGNVQSPNPRQNLTFDIISPQGHVIHPPKNGWRWSKKKMQEFIDNGVIVFLDNGTRLIKKTYLKDQEGIVPSNIWWDIEVTGHNRNAKYELKKIFSELKTSDIFKTPKPTKFIQRILELTTTKNSTILDFFAGSGTTMHSTMLLNKKDNGNRSCILVQSKEGNICEEFTYERNRRVIQGYTTSKNEQVAGLTKNNLRYYKADFIPREPSSRNKRELVKAATDLLCIKENMYQEAKITCNGKTLRKDYARRFTEGGKEMIVIYEPAVIKYIVEELKAWDKKEFIKVYVFSEGRYAYDDDFKDVLDKVTLCALPDAIYQAYRRVLPRRKKSQPISMQLSEEEQAEVLADAAQYSYKEQEGGES